MDAETGHRIVVTAAPADIDELQHVSNLVYLRWVLQAARDHSSARGWDHAAYLRLGAIWVVRRHEIDYAHPAQLGEEIAVTTWVDTWKRASCIRRTVLVRVGDARTVSRAATQWALVSLADGRPTKIPDPLRTSFGG